MKTSQNYYKLLITGPFWLYLLYYREFLLIGLNMAKMFSTIPPFLCKSSRDQKWVPVTVFDGHCVHNQVSDLKLQNVLCFYFSYTSKQKSGFLIF